MKIHYEQSEIIRNIYVLTLAIITFLIHIYIHFLIHIYQYMKWPRKSNQKKYFPGGRVEKATFRQSRMKSV